MMTYDELTKRFNTYDPNTAQMWGVYNGTNFKAFAHLGHAINSFAYQYRARLFMMTPDCGWTEVGIKTGNQSGPCEFCGETTTWEGWRKVKGRHPSPPQYGFVCPNHLDLWVA